MSVAGWGYPWGGAGSGGMPAASCSVLIPKFVYYSQTVTITTNSNDQIQFTEGGGNLTATIAAGTYAWGALAQYVKIALEAAGAGDYTVSYSATTRKFTLTKSAGAFTLDHGGATYDALPTLGFTGDKSGSLSYTSDSSVPSTTTITCTQRARYLNVADEVERDDYEGASGRRESALVSAAERIAFTLEFESTATHQALRDMWRQAGRWGGAIDYYPDSTTSDYITVYWDQKQFPLTEMTRSRNLYRHYEGELVFRVKVPAGGTLTARSFDDRRPSS